MAQVGIRPAGGTTKAAVWLRWWTPTCPSQILVTHTGKVGVRLVKYPRRIVLKRLEITTVVTRPDP